MAPESHLLEFECAFDESPAGSLGRTLRVQQPKSQITLRFTDKKLFSIRAWVGITNNANKPPVGCKYSDGVNPQKSLTVTGSAETPIDIYGLAMNKEYTVTVTCDPNLTHTEKVPFSAEECESATA